jgi:hypothetical protein
VELPRLLIAEDQDAIASRLRRALSNEYEASVISPGKRALAVSVVSPGKRALDLPTIETRGPRPRP